MLKIYHNPRCRKSREGLEFLKSKGVEVVVVDYLKNGLTRNDLKEITLKMNTSAETLVRKQESVYKLELKGKTFTEEEWVQIITENPQLLQRPLVVSRTKAVLAQPPEKVDTLL